ncbi:hypothetical protein [Enterobacter phage 04_vB_Eclo_IJM]|nr:hypothetical protein [Enterobacter phage 04_vB_Eclo_IJM]
MAWTLQSKRLWDLRSSTPLWWRHKGLSTSW